MYLFLTSSVGIVAQDIFPRVMKHIDNTRLLFITTASEGSTGDMSRLEKDKQGLRDAGFDLEDYSVTGKKREEITKKMEGIGTLCVGGGNTYYLLHETRKSGFDEIIREKVMSGMPYIGSSAGSLIMGPTIETSLDDPDTVPELKDYRGLGITNISVRPHWGSDDFQERYRQEYDRLYGLSVGMVLLTDYQYLLVHDDWHQIITVPGPTGLKN